jgi:DNA invertase Pin-like site-specific DNA recombinase
MKSKQNKIETKREAISYGRFSSGEQDTGDSENRQRMAFESVCGRYELTPSARFGFGEFFGRGESGFHAKHLKAGGSLRRFLDMLKDGTINPASTVLVVEMWSRFGRTQPAEAVKLLADIVATGCVVAVHSPDMWVDSANLASQQFIMIAMCLQMAHGESAEKSRIGKANRERIRTSGKTKHGKVPKTCPKWLNVNADGTGYEFNEQAEALRKAALMSIAGHGQTAIGRELGISSSGLTGIFRERTLIGEFTPHYRDENRKPAGEAVEGKYPALLSVDEFRQLQASLDSRVKQKAKKGKFVSNLFTGIVWNEKGEQLAVWKKNGGALYLKPYGDGKRLPGKLVEYALVEETVLDLFAGIDQSQLYPKDTNEEAKQLAELKARVADLNAKRETWELEALEGGSSALSRLIVNAEKKADELKAEAEAIETKLSTNKADTLPVTQALITELMKGKEGSELLDMRTKLKGLLALSISSIVVEVFGTKSAGISVTLRNGNEIRTGEFSKAKGMTVGMREIA